MSAPEFERWIKLDRLPAGPVEIEAGEDERAALSRRFGLPRIRSFRARVTLVQHGDTIDSTGNLEASFQQRCAVSDEPFDTQLHEPLSLRFVPRLPAVGEDEEMEFADGAPDEIEYAGLAFDLGEAVAQSFGLALDPYPLGPDADSARKEAGLVDENAPSGPFAALAALRHDGKAPG